MKMTESLRGRVAIVTGASSGLGRATAIALAAEGARIIATARRAAHLEMLASEIKRSGGECIFIPGDAGEAATADSAVRAAIEHFGRLDILINSAGQGNYKKLVDTTVDDYNELVNSNFRSTFLFSRFVASHFIDQQSGIIVIVSSVAGLTGAPNEAVYSATKFAQIGFAQSIDLELRPFGIRVCAICPGGMKSEFAIGRGRTEAGVAASVMLEPSEVAQTIVFACEQPTNVRLQELVVRHMGHSK